MDLSKYYAEICKQPLLTREQEENLFKEYYSKDVTEKRKEAIKDKIIRANMRFAFKQAKYYSKNDLDTFEVLISAGNEGLLVGFYKFNPNNGVRYLSYAGSWVFQRILKEMSKMRIVSLPIWKQQLASKIQRMVETTEALTLEDIKKDLVEQGISPKDVEELFNTRYLTYYVDDLDESEFLINPIEEEVDKKMDEERIWKMIHSLPSPHREVVARCYGFEDGKEHSPAKIAKALKVPKDDIQRLKEEGLAMLKEKFKG